VIKDPANVLLFSDVLLPAVELGLPGQLLNSLEMPCPFAGWGGRAGQVVQGWCRRAGEQNIGCLSNEVLDR